MMDRPQIRLNYWRPCLSILLVLSIHSLLFGQAIVLHADFDQGSLDVANSSATGSLVQLTGRDNHHPGKWKWIYFSATDVMGQALTFQIDDGFETGGGNLVGHAMVYSFDQQTWHFFDNNQRDAGANTFTFWNNAPFAQSTVFVAYGLPYPFSRSAGHTQSMLANPWVTPTVSANANLALGQSPGGIDDLGRMIPPHDLFGYRVTDPIGTPQRARVVLAGGIHANESLGNYVLEGLVNFLTGSDFDAALLRKYADFYVYPMVNPDGRYAGYNRSTVANESQDPNRFWLPSSYGGIPEVGTFGSAMISDSGGVDYLIDFHSTVVGKDGHFGLVHPAMQLDPFWQTILTLEPDLQTQNALLADDTLAKFGRDTLNANFSITLETQFIPGENIDRFLDLGRNFGLAFASTLTILGDLDLDLQLDVGDFQILMAHAETELNGLSTIDAYLRGDLNRDGENNIVDFGIFKDAVITRLGPDAFHQMLLQIPEPGCMPLTAIACLVATRRGLRWLQGR
jgi:hypothetical protein